MKIVYNDIIPFEGFIAINLFGYLFVRKKFKDTLGKVDINHESIHTQLMKELGYIFFYIWYIIEWLIRFFINSNPYRSISFEKEAYANETDLKYLEKRKLFTFIKYI